MKTTLTLAIMITSVLGFGQTNSQSSTIFENGKMNSPENLFINYEINSQPGHSKISQTNTIAQKDSTYLWFWSTANNAWNTEPSVKITGYTYNSSNYVTSLMRENWNGSVWNISGKYFFTYNTSNKLTSNYAQNWNGTSWENYYRYSYTYDGNGNQTNYLYETGNGNLWVNDKQIACTYDANNNKTFVLNQTWNGSSWDNVSRDCYTYSSNKVITHLFQNWLSGSWNDSIKSTYAYDVNNDQVGSLTQMWNGSSWDNYSQFSFNYDVNHNPIASIEQAWDDTIWVNLQKADMVYDTNHNLISELYQSWGGTSWGNTLQNFYTWSSTNTITNSLFQKWVGSSWITSNTYDQNFDTNGSLESEKRFAWDNTGVQIISGDSTFHYNQTVVTGITEVSKNKTISVYPNPATSELNISTLMDYKSIKLVNSLGETIRIETNKPEAISVSELNNGVYFVQLMDKKGAVMSTKKFVKD
ncbi:MAG: T9SS type A sorting domain-containing protein [Bacteroidota bacterium]